MTASVEMTPPNHKVTPVPHREQGFVLAMTLVFLLLLTIIGVTAMNTTSLEEKMAHNVKDKNLSLDAAESALRLAENYLKSYEYRILNPNPSSGDTSDGLHYSVGYTGTQLWRPEAGTWASSDVQEYPSVPGGGPAISGGFINPKPYADDPDYFIEQITGQEKCAPEGSLRVDAPGNCTTFLITARGVGGTDMAVSMIQATFKKKED
jgi:type IV pilus assembly protein PilX